MQTEHRKHLSARTIVLLGLLTGVVVGLLGCAHAAAPIRVPVFLPVLVEPSCEPENILQICVIECGKKMPAKQALGAMETRDGNHWCACKEFDL